MMNARNAIEELHSLLEQVKDYVGGPAFETERSQARIEFFGSGNPEFTDSDDMLQRCAAYYDWFIFDRDHSAAARTPLSLFVAEHPELPERVRTNLLACQRSLTSEFEVKQVSADYVVVLDLNGTEDDYYKVAHRHCGTSFSVGQVVRARLLRWDNQYYFHGQVEAWPASLSELRQLTDPLPREVREPAAEARTIHTRTARLDVLTRGQWLRERRRQP